MGRRRGRMRKGKGREKERWKEDRRGEREM